MEGQRPAGRVADRSGWAFPGAVLGSVAVHALLIALLVPMRDLSPRPVPAGFQEIPVELVIDGSGAPRRMPIPLTAAVPAAPPADLAPAADAAAPPSAPPVVGLAPVAPDAPVPGLAPVAPDAPVSGLAPVVPDAPVPGLAPAAATAEAAAIAPAADAPSAPAIVEAQAPRETVPAGALLPADAPTALPASEPPPPDQPGTRLAALPPPPAPPDPAGAMAAPVPLPPSPAGRPAAPPAILPLPSSAPEMTAAAAEGEAATPAAAPLRAAEPLPPLDAAGPARDDAPLSPAADAPALVAARAEPVPPGPAAAPVVVRDESAPLGPAPPSIDVASAGAPAPSVAPREDPPLPGAIGPDAPAPADVQAREAAATAGAANAPPPAPDLVGQEPAPQALPDERPERPAGSRLAALVEPPVQGAPSPERAVAAALKNLDCARVSARFDPGRQVVELAGHVSSGAQQAHLRQQLANLPNVRVVQDQALSIVGDPFCRVLTFLERPGLARSEDQKQDLARIIGAAGEAGVVRFTDGMLLRLDLQAPKFPSYVYVDYFTADGKVHHLLPGDDPRGNRFAPDERFVLGGATGRGPRNARIGPPYGLDLVVAIASDAPLFSPPRRTTESAAAYLAALHATLDDRSRRGTPPRLEYAYFIINTAER
jgi:hypothetical protein